VTELVATAVPASAHSVLISMTPAVGSTVSAASSAVRLTFDESIQDIGEEVQVKDPAGVRVDRGTPVIIDATVTRTLAPLTRAGRYT